jgi:hypothetical protein
MGTQRSLEERIHCRDTSEPLPFPGSRGAIYESGTFDFDFVDGFAIGFRKPVSLIKSTKNRQEKISLRT